MMILQTIAAFLLALGPLIIFHELGHYTVARLCGVKVLRFSVGMGKVVWSRRFGRDQTEWAISALPLGGYVKMLDNRDPETAAASAADLPREFTSQNVWRRIAIVAAGPLANFLLAIVVFSGLYMYGMEEPGTRLRFAPESSALYQAGVRAGDQVVAVNGEPVATWSELRWGVMSAMLDRQALRLDLRQPGGARYSALIASATFKDVDPDSDVLGALGIAVERPPAVLGKIIDGGAAQRAGLQSGDQITAIDGKPVADALVVIDIVRRSNGRTMLFSGLRGGAPFSAEVTPDIDGATKSARIKAEVMSVPELVRVSAGPVSALGRALRSTWDNVAMTLKMIGKMITGEVSLKNVTGPITIADYAGKTASSGLLPFLHFIAIISISLGVMNLLPIPVLDGGHLLYYSLEVLTGRPLSERFGELAQRAGVGLLFMLMALAVFNDVARLL